MRCSDAHVSTRALRFFLLPFGKGAIGRSPSIELLTPAGAAGLDDVIGTLERKVRKKRILRFLIFA